MMGCVGRGGVGGGLVAFLEVCSIREGRGVSFSFLFILSVPIGQGFVCFCG